MYDITDRKSFDNVEMWVNSIKDSIDSGNNSKYEIFLIGNKLDLINEEGKERQVTEEEAKDACNKFNMIWGNELSTKDIKYDDLKNIFEKYVRDLYQKVGEKQVKKQKIQKVQKYKKKGKCPLF